MLDAEKRNWCLQHSEEIETIHFGIRYEPLQLLGQATANPPNEEKSIDTKHWVLVFAPPSREFAFTFEVMPGDDERKSICTPIGYHKGRYTAFPLGTYHGRWDDLLQVLQAHPQRGSSYSVRFNNCQHFVAIYLLLLKAFAKSRCSRTTRFRWPKRIDTLLQVLESGSQGSIWNKPNPALGAALFLPVTLGGGVMAAEATAAMVAPGLLGTATTAVIPAACTTFATFCAPVMLAAAGYYVGKHFLWEPDEWRKSTSFIDPQVIGFPVKQRSPLTAQECSLSKTSPDQRSSGILSSSRLAHIPAPAFRDLEDDTWVPQAIRMAGATLLYELVREFNRDPRVVNDIDPGSFFHVCES